MYFINQNNELAEAAALTANLQLESIDMPRQEELEEELGAYYINSLKTESILTSFVSPGEMKGLIGGFNPLAIGKKILQQVRKAICAVLNEGSTASEIAEAVLQVLTGIIPGGPIIKLVAQKVVKFILGKGIGTFCNI